MPAPFLGEVRMTIFPKRVGIWCEILNWFLKSRRMNYVFVLTFGWFIFQINQWNLHELQVTACFSYKGTFCQDVFGNVNEYSMMGMNDITSILTPSKRDEPRRLQQHVAKWAQKSQWEVGASNSTYRGEITPVKTHWFSNSATQVTSNLKYDRLFGADFCAFFFFRWRILMVGESHLSFLQIPIVDKTSLMLKPRFFEISEFQPERICKC